MSCYHVSPITEVETQGTQRRQVSYDPNVKNVKYKKWNQQDLFKELFLELYLLLGFIRIRKTFDFSAVVSTDHCHISPITHMGT